MFIRMHTSCPDGISNRTSIVRSYSREIESWSVIIERGFLLLRGRSRIAFRYHRRAILRRTRSRDSSAVSCGREDSFHDIRITKKNYDRPVHHRRWYVKAASNSEYHSSYGVIALFCLEEVLLYFRRFSLKISIDSTFRKGKNVETISCYLDDKLQHLAAHRTLCAALLSA